MMSPNSNPLALQRWLPAVKTLDTGEISMLWQLDLEPRYREEGGYIPG